MRGTATSIPSGYFPELPRKGGRVSAQISGRDEIVLSGYLSHQDGSLEREEGRERGRERGTEGGREVGRERGREGGREREREGGRERERGR